MHEPAWIGQLIALCEVHYGARHLLVYYDMVAQVFARIDQLIAVSGGATVLQCYNLLLASQQSGCAARFRP